MGKCCNGFSSQYFHGFYCLKASLSQSPVVLLGIARLLLHSEWIMAGPASVT